jgi:hypothetical protein
MTTAEEEPMPTEAPAEPEAEPEAELETEASEADERLPTGPNYLVLHDMVGAFEKGRIVPGSAFPDVDTLLSLGAIVEIDESGQPVAAEEEVAAEETDSQ